MQALFSAAWTVSANRLYFTLHKPKRTVVIYRNENDLRKLEEIRFFGERWSVERKVQWPEDNVHDLPYGKEKIGGVAFEGIQKLMRIMEDYEAVFVSGVSATLRNGIVKYCVEKNKACYFVPHTGDVIISGAEHIRSFAVPICRARRKMCIRDSLGPCASCPGNADEPLYPQRSGRLSPIYVEIKR